MVFEIPIPYTPVPLIVQFVVYWCARGKACGTFPG